MFHFACVREHGRKHRKPLPRLFQNVRAGKGQTDDIFQDVDHFISRGHQLRIDSLDRYFVCQGVHASIATGITSSSKPIIMFAHGTAHIRATRYVTVPCVS